MIQANELRIGNLMIMSFENSVEIVTSRTIGFINQANSRSQSHPFEPIPLDEDWLIKMGAFRSSFIDFQFEFKDSDYRVCEYDGKFIFRGLGASVIEVKTVHHLQNLYHSLTGQELTVL